MHLLNKSHIGLLLVFWLLLPPTTFAQNRALRAGQSDPQPVLQEIQQAYQNGQLNLDQKVLYQLYAGLNPQVLPAEYQPEHQEPVKCGFPALREYEVNRDHLSPATVSKIRSLLERRTQAQQSYLSPSGKFRIHYDMSGEDAVPAGDTDQNGVPDYVEWVAAAADSSWRHEVQRLGHSDPVAGNSSPYPIFLENINYYGYTEYGYQRSGVTADTYIVIENDFSENFPPNDDPEGNQKGAVKVTVAHELKHAIQYANSEWYGWPGDPDSPHGYDWSEMDATSMEEIVYDNVNDYYNYIDENGSSVFVTDDHSIPVAYDGVTWFIYFEERFGDTFWPTVWDRIKQRFEEQQNRQTPDYLTLVEAVTNTLQGDFDSSFELAMAESHLWHYASGDFSSEDYGFGERASYPTPTINVNLAARDSIMTSRSLPPLSAEYVEITKGEPLIGYVKVSAEYEDPSVNFGIIGYFKDGHTETLLRPASSAKKWKMTTTWPWDEISSVGIVAANSSNETHSRYKLKVTLAVPQELTLLQNYPNPFNPGTTISFSLPEPTDVDLTVYNTVGQRVAKLIDHRRMSSGFYEVPFEGGNLASGIYFYRLKTDQKAVVKKMTLIK